MLAAWATKILVLTPTLATSKTSLITNYLFHPKIKMVFLYHVLVF